MNLTWEEYQDTPLIVIMRDIEMLSLENKVLELKKETKQKKKL
jgi:hypothetical protein